MVHINLHHFVCTVVVIIPEVGPRRLEYASTRHPDIGNVPKLLHTAGDQIVERLPGCHIAVLKHDASMLYPGDILSCVRHEFQVADEYTRSTFMA
jgi:hypothetical protein